MSHETDPPLLTLAGLAHRCAQESEHFFRRQSHDPRYCFELFRRAILDRNQRAWNFLYTQYRPLVAGWVERHSAFPASGEEVQFFVNRAFEKMWVAVTPEKLDRFADLKSLLGYLQTCVHSVILDQVRLAEKHALDLGEEVLPIERRGEDSTVEEQALKRAHAEEFWQWLGTRVRDEKERRVLYGSFVLALKPRELYAQFPETFRDVGEIYRVKQNVLARLSRDPELEKFVGQDA